MKQTTTIRGLLIAGLLIIGSLGVLQAAQFTLSWTDNSNNELGFKIERAENGGEFQEIATVGIDVETYVDADLPPNTTYSYRLRAYNALLDGRLQYSAYSNTATGKTPPPLDPNAPDAPGESLNITWPSRLVNLSTRVPPADLSTEPIIAGFVVQGTSPRKVLIRGVGPGLAQLGVPDYLPDPTMQLVGGASNDNWSGNDLVIAMQKIGAFPLQAGSKDAALLVTLDPGSYTVHLGSADGGQGTVLIEVYTVD